MNNLKSNIYAILGVGAKNSNWNADFDGNPKTDGNGNIKGSPYALQFCIKKSWFNRGEMVLGVRTNNGKNVNQLKDRYENLFDTKIDKNTSICDIKSNLDKTRDCKNFGYVFAPKGAVSTQSQGVVQICDGLNKYEDTVINTETILSPYASAEDNGMSTNGARVTTDEAHYLYPVTITPNGSDYTEEDYIDFKETSLNAVSLYNSKSKTGCTNEIGIFVKVKEEYNYILALGDLTDYVDVYKEENKLIHDLTRLEVLLNDCKEKIIDVEIYYKSKNNSIKGFENSKLNIRKFNIVTRKVL